MSRTHKNFRRKWIPLAQKFTELQNKSSCENYAFVLPSKTDLLPNSMFLAHRLAPSHRQHVVFLWLAALILGGQVGPRNYPIFYLLAGNRCVSLFTRFPTLRAIVPRRLGASGAVAALMGAFLVRFPKLKIHMLWYMLIFRVRFKAPAYWLLPLWLLHGGLLRQPIRPSFRSGTLGACRRICLWSGSSAGHRAYGFGARGECGH